MLTERLIIRDARLEDAPFLAKCYPGDIYRDLRRKTFTEFWPELAEEEATYDQETDPGEYYLDCVAVLPAYRRRGIGRALLKDGIAKGICLVRLLGESFLLPGRLAEQAARDWP